ncbi:TPA: ATP synthase F0 subunit B [Candidatus Nomurabacteria bacterium]|nr:MAG: ATP synthase subunit b [Candidatus Nomurabacteria bacterium GW2011_GWE2_36_115]KKP94221.1 MAG: ATP synthase subunit b [Candidatus Nomurabacteria bacterium GW2011_GWF2_36_126]KKP96651.1 MAG: ATP synthase subunit b [Candidatus Nomurabacteria bacterium GW2011_GWD2_36_14]KKP99745.1 MAG: ATP synthase subunit b [Candidatus Nomurabacteria bacterium GW2011_GWF2_36_19]KKQ05309.1 MAG: ATP synthase subunit b [Candidatus Nomurabacteria bacterium GW2011_GWF1_36_47]KKQ08989.1 MAG: ATP synthase subun
MDSFIETFHIDWKIIIAQAINFVVVLFILQYLALKPLKKLMKERSERIEGGLNDAVKNAEILKSTKAEYDEVIAKARQEAHTIFQDGKKEAEEKKKEMLASASLEVENMIVNGKKVLESEKNKMIEEAKTEIVSLVVKATEKLLETHKDESFDKKALEEIKKIS